ncbi:hypothetical protein DmGdi_20870 [Gluconobacter sp. Gdi]|nr:hypothetical protein DmGdi_20870 [Gluconobacter sp. Gdi]
MLQVLRVGCPWWDMYERYGKWNSLYVLFRRWAEQGVWNALLQTLVELGLTDAGSIWSMVPWFMPIHRLRAQKGGHAEIMAGHRRLYEQNPYPMRQSGTPSWLVLTEGQVSGYTATDALIVLPAPNPRAMLTGRGYDSDSFRQALLIHRILPVIPS